MVPLGIELVLQRGEPGLFESRLRGVLTEGLVFPPRVEVTVEVNRRTGRDATRRGDSGS